MTVLAPAVGGGMNLHVPPAHGAIGKAQHAMAVIRPRAPIALARVDDQIAAADTGEPPSAAAFPLPVQYFLTIGAASGGE